MKKHLKKYWWIFLPVLLVTLFFTNLSLGSVQIPFSETVSILTGGDPLQPAWAEILFNFRLTKAITCILGGAALSLGGLLMQTLFRNPLAGPDVLGLSSGASLAVALLVMLSGLGNSLFSSSFSMAIAASLGSASVFFIVLIIARYIRDNTSLLIIGLMLGAGTSSIVSVLQFISRAEDQQYYLVWTFGSLGSLNWNEIYVLSMAVLVGVVMASITIKLLNGWQLGDNYAQSLGINLKRTRLVMIITTSILTGGVTAFCGPIAFIGLAVPHLTRLFVDSTNHKILIPAVMLSGAIMLLFCDILAQVPGTSYVLPINAITALIGAPVVIWMILQHKKLRM